jgi:hypothetical protein
MTIDLSCLQLGNACISDIPGELFCEYQLATQAMKPEVTVCRSAYGVYGSACIGTEIAFWKGGCETQPSSSKAAQ